jgi:thiamine transporter
LDLIKNEGKIVVEAGIFVSLALLLEFLTLFVPGMPQGGKFISPGMIPLIIFSLFRGWKWGILMGAVFGILYFYLFDRFWVHPVQFMLDYILAFGFVGSAGIFSSKYLFEKKWIIPLSVLMACFLRFLAHFASGIIFIDLIKPGIENPWMYSLLYNLTYTIPTALVCLFIVPPLVKRLRSFFHIKTTDNLELEKNIEEKRHFTGEYNNTN